MMYAGEFKDKVCLLIGCSRATGSLLAKRYLEEGLNVVIADINPDILKLAEELKEEFPHNKGYGVVTDVIVEDDIKSLINGVKENLGSIDMMHYHAGLIAPLLPISELTQDWFDLLYKVNFRGAAFAIKHVAPIMKDQRKGSIVTTSSWYGRKGYENSAAYCGSKAAIINLTQVAALELGPYGIKVNTIAPGDVESTMLTESMKIKAEIDGVTFEELMQARMDQHPLGKIATFTDVAQVALFYSSSQCGHTTGQTIYVAGGAELCF